MSTAIETADRTVPREWSVPRLDDLAFLAVLAAMAAATLALLTTAMPAAAQMAGGATTGADAAMERHLRRDYKNLGQRTWVNSMMPAAAGAAAPAVSADQQLQQQVAGYTRDLLDRGGWRNAWAANNHYAAGEPLLAAAVGTGVTSPGAAIELAPRPLAALRIHAFARLQIKGLP